MVKELEIFLYTVDSTPNVPWKVTLYCIKVFDNFLYFSFHSAYKLIAKILRHAKRYILFDSRQDIHRTVVVLFYLYNLREKRSVLLTK